VRRPSVLVVIALLVLSMVASGCGQTAPQTAPKPAATPAPAPAAKPAELPVKSLVITAGTVGGGWYLAAARIAEFLQKDIPGLKVTVTEGLALDNIKLVNKGRDADIGITGTPMFIEAMNGVGSFKDGKLTNIGGLLTFAVDTLQIAATQKSNIKTLKDMKNKRIMPDRPGTGTEVMARGLLNINGMTYDSINKAGGKVQHITGEESPQLMRDGHLDTLFVKGRIPFSTILDLQTNVPIRMIPLDNDTLDKFLKANPGYVKSVIPAKTYTGQTEDVQAVGHSSLMYVRKDLPADFVEKVTASILSHAEEINKGVAGMAFSNLKAKAMVGLADKDMHAAVMKLFK